MNSMSSYPYVHSKMRPSEAPPRTHERRSISAHKTKPDFPPLCSPILKSFCLARSVEAETATAQPPCKPGPGLRQRRQQRLRHGAGAHTPPPLPERRRGRRRSLSQGPRWERILAGIRGQRQARVLVPVGRGRRGAPGAGARPPRTLAPVLVPLPLSVEAFVAIAVAADVVPAALARDIAAQEEEREGERWRRKVRRIKAFYKFFEFFFCMFVFFAVRPKSCHGAKFFVMAGKGRVDSAVSEDVLFSGEIPLSFRAFPTNRPYRVDRRGPLRGEGARIAVSLCVVQALPGGREW